MIGGEATLFNTIVAANHIGESLAPDDVDGILDANASTSNLIGAGSCLKNGVNGNQVGTAAAPIDPKLTRMGNYGGPTQTMELLPGSPAIERGNNAAPFLPATDQRGLARIVNTTVNIGAFESQGFAIALALGSGQSAPAGTPFAAPLVVSVTANGPGVPVAGIVVTFAARGSGASATLASNTATVAADGTARVAATANNTIGGYTVTATAAGVAGKTSFTLTNVGTPTANGQSLNVGFNTAATVTMTASDPDNPPLPLMYAVANGPSHGVLAGTAPKLTYTPNAGYHGPDGFTFTASNGISTSSPATIRLSVAPGVPTANNQTLSVN